MNFHTSRIAAVSSLAVAAFVGLAATSPVKVPHWYHATSLQAPVHYHTEPWQSTIGISYDYHYARKGYRYGGSRVPLFDAFGVANLLTLGRGLETPGATTKMYWNAHLDKNTPGKFDYDDAAHPMPASPNGTMSLEGRVKRESFDLWVQQALWYGLWVKVTVPFARVRVDHLKTKLRGATTIKDRAGNDVDMQDFIKTTLPTILAEAGLKPLTDSHHKSGIADVKAGAGWSDSMQTGNCVVSDIGGTLEGYALIPAVNRRDYNRVTSLNLGHGHDWGIGGRIGACIGLFSMAQAEVHGGFTTFFAHDRVIRVASDPKKQQTGLLILEKARVRTEQGTLWDVGGMLGTKPCALWGVVARVGYTFVRQEETKSHVRDENYLKTTIKNAQAGGDDDAKIRFISQDYVADKTSYFAAWEQHMFHLEVGYDGQGSDLCYGIMPRITFRYDQVVAGRRTVDGFGLGGQASLSCSWDF